MIHAIYIHDSKTSWTLIGAGKDAFEAIEDALDNMTKAQRGCRDITLFKHQKHHGIEMSEVEDLECVQIEQLVKERRTNNVRENITG